jgi:hypothetical protein
MDHEAFEVDEKLIILTNEECISCGIGDPIIVFTYEVIE